MFHAHDVIIHFEICVNYIFKFSSLSDITQARKKVPFPALQSVFWRLYAIKTIPKEQNCSF